MNSLCPFFKEKCHGNQCKMWKEEECLLVRFLESFQEFTSEKASTDSSNETIEMRSLHFDREADTVPKWLEIATPEGLAKEMLEFKDEEFPKDERVHFHILSSFFWNKKGVQRYDLPSEIQLKMEQANIKAERQLAKEEEDKKKARLAEEKEELPSLVCQCVDWARVSGLKRVSLSDIDTFMMEKDMDVLKETKKALYSMANVKLKTGK